MKPRSRSVEREPGVVGGFTLRGTFDEGGTMSTPLSSFVLESISKRRTSTMTPAEFVENIPAPFARAFPERDAWAQHGEWYKCRCQTSAEAAVAYCFRTRNGMVWCEPEREETDCEARDITALVATVVRSLSFGGVGGVEPLPMPTPSGLPGADDRWFKQNFGVKS